MDRQFPPPGVKLGASYDRNLKVIFNGKGFSRVLNNKAKRGCAARGPLPPGGVRAAREGRKWRERPPFFTLQSAPPSRDDNCGTIDVRSGATCPARAGPDEVAAGGVEV